MPDQQAYEARHSQEREAKDKLKSRLSVGPETEFLEHSDTRHGLRVGEYAGEWKKTILNESESTSQASMLAIPVSQYVRRPMDGNYGEPHETKDTACKRAREARSKKGKLMRKRYRRPRPQSFANN